MKAVLAILFLIVSYSSWATVTVAVVDCPVQFEGRVKEVIEPVGPTSAFTMNKVVFSNLRTLKGEAEEQILLDVLQNGPFKVEPDKDYLVQVRNGRLCWMEEI